MENIRKLSKSAIFEDISPEAIEELCACGRTLSLEEGHRLFDLGEDANELMILEDGAVELFFPVRVIGVTRELTLERKQVGDVVAWSALISPHRFTLSARCASKCVLACLSREDLHDHFDTDPEVGYLFMRNLAGVIGKRLNNMQDVWVRELQSSAVERLE